MTIDSKLLPRISAQLLRCKNSCGPALPKPLVDLRLCSGVIVCAFGMVLLSACSATPDKEPVQDATATAASQGISEALSRSAEQRIATAVAATLTTQTLASPAGVAATPTPIVRDSTRVV